MGGQYYAHLDPHGYYQNDSSIRPDAKTPYFEVGIHRTFLVPKKDWKFGNCLFNRSEETASLHLWCTSLMWPPEATPCFRSLASRRALRAALESSGSTW